MCVARIAEDEKEKGRRRKRKAKGNAAQVEESIHGMDGRAGPKSENVVLQKSEYMWPLAVARLAICCSWYRVISDTFVR